MRKNIALMTWHHVENYGTAYQAYALKTVISNMGYNVDLINYYRDNYQIVDKRDFREYIKIYLKKFKHQKGDSYQFEKSLFDDFFNRYFTYTDECNSVQDFLELNNIYQAFVCGSDQIWNPKWYNPHYFLDFVIDNNRKIAYAPSIGISNINNFNSASEVLKQINAISHVSIREKSSCTEIGNIIRGKEIHNVLDPTLLLTKDEWDGLLEGHTNEYKEEYMLIFFLKNNEKYLQIAIKEAKSKNLIPIVMHSTQGSDNQYANVKMPTPNDMLGLIKHAQFVCTDSYHIMIFSIIYNRQFRVFKKFENGGTLSQNNRLTDLLKVLELDFCLYNHDFITGIDYSFVNAKLKEERKKSLLFLARSLEDSVRNASNTDINGNYCDKCVPCTGKKNPIAEEYIQGLNSKEKRFYDNYMSWLGFDLDDKCFECKFLKEKRLGDYQIKPLFYTQLISDMSLRKNIRYIYKEYYKWYVIPNVIKQYMRR